MCSGYGDAEVYTQPFRRSHPQHINHFRIRKSGSKKLLPHKSIWNGQGMLKLTLSSSVPSFSVAVELPHRWCLSDHNNGRPSLLGSCSLKGSFKWNFCCLRGEMQMGEWENDSGCWVDCENENEAVAAALPTKWRGLGVVIGVDLT